MLSGNGLIPDVLTDTISTTNATMSDNEVGGGSRCRLMATRKMIFFFSSPVCLGCDNRTYILCCTPQAGSERPAQTVRYNFEDVGSEPCVDMEN